MMPRVVHREGWTPGITGRQYTREASSCTRLGTKSHRDRQRGSAASGGAPRKLAPRGQELPENVKVKGQSWT